MLLNFPQPNRQTSVHFRSERAPFIQELKRLAVEERGVVFLDAGLGPTWRHKIVGFGVPAKQIVTSKEGEQAKSWRLVGAALELLSRRGHERNAPIVAIGGGATCDACALIASLYMRGIPLVLVPTTILAMVDAAVGGKTAVDLTRNGKLFKNVAGTFYPARSVELWPGWLATLATEERLSGIGELLKTLWIAGVRTSPGQFDRWVKGLEAEAIVWPYVEKAVATKAAIVEADPLDTLGKRSLLNYGHTVGHAFESLAKGKLAHGAAISLGMIVESAFAKANSDFLDYIQEEITTYGFTLPKTMRNLAAASIMPFLRADKKVAQGKINMDVLVDVGQASRVVTSPMELASFCSEWTRRL